jgi:hypothetical protein
VDRLPQIIARAGPQRFESLSRRRQIDISGDFLPQCTARCATQSTVRPSSLAVFAASQEPFSPQLPMCPSAAHTRHYFVTPSLLLTNRISWTCPPPIADWQATSGPLPCR